MHTICLRLAPTNQRREDPCAGLPHPPRPPPWCVPTDRRTGPCHHRRPLTRRVPSLRKRRRARPPRPLAHPLHLPRRARSVRSCAHAVALEPAAPARAGLPYARCTQRRTGAAAAALPAHKHSSTQANCSMRISARVTGLRRAAHAARVHVCDHACDPARVCCESHVVYVQVLRVRMRVRAVHGLHRACQHARTFRIFASFVPCGGRTWRHGGYSSGLGLGLGLGTLWNVGGGGYPARRPGLSCSCTCQALGTPSCATSTN